MALCCCLFSGVSRAEIRCHYEYGGQATILEVAPDVDPYRAPVLKIGSYLMFRVVWQTTPPAHAAVHTYVYVDTGDAPIILQQGSWSLPQINAAHYGFTGRQRVYEPARDSELQYWCESSATDTRAP